MNEQFSLCLTLLFGEETKVKVQENIHEYLLHGCVFFFFFFLFCYIKEQSDKLTLVFSSIF